MNEFQARPGTPYTPPQGPLRVLYRDDDLVAVEKPAGLLSVPGRGSALADCMLDRLVQVCPGALMVHRLDRDTSGVMVFALRRSAQRHLGLSFERRRVEKRYIAVVAGCVAQAAGSIDLPLIVDWPRRPMQKVEFSTGKPATTQWRRLVCGPRQSRLEICPLTGRTHQIRVHLREIGHPVLGDPFYASAAASATPRMMLHAEWLKLRHPADGRWISFHAPCPF